MHARCVEASRLKRAVRPSRSHDPALRCTEVLVLSGLSDMDAGARLGTEVRGGHLSVSLSFHVKDKRFENRSSGTSLKSAQKPPIKVGHHFFPSY